MDPIKDIFSRAFPDEHLIGDSCADQPRPNYWLIYGSSGMPRWVVPRDPRIGLPVLNQWHPFQLRSRLKWTALLGTYRAGLLGRLPGIRPLYLKVPQWLEEHGIPVFYIGTPSHVSKLVITLMDPKTAKPVSILKVPVGEKAADNIVYEADMLKQLTAWKPRFGPELLSIMPQRGHSRQEALIGTMASMELTKEHFKMLLDLRHEGQFTTVSEQLTALDVKCMSVDLSLPEKAVYQEIRNFLQDETSLPQFWLHGDFSPWNVLQCKTGARLIDWERSRVNGLPLLDLFHFLAMQKLIRNERMPADMSDHPAVNQYLEQNAFRPPDIVLKKLYLYYRVEHWLNANWEEASQYGPPAFQKMIACWEAIR